MRQDVAVLASAVLSFGIACGAEVRGHESGLGEGTSATLGDTAPASETGGTSLGGDDADEKLDLAPASDVGLEGCAGDSHGGPGGGEGEGDLEFSYIWIANSGEGTMSKIDTQTLVEEGRYLVREDGEGSPSRTSVNLSGDVAIANRMGGVTKVLALEERCSDRNANGTIETSQGGTDVLAWGADECVAWHTPLEAISNRPMAWAQGQWNPSTCKYDDEDLWTATMTEEEGVKVHLLDGDGGTLVQSVHIPEMGNTDYFGIYGGAVDGEGNFWGSNMNGGRLVYVDKQTFAHDTWPIPIAGYGITVDSDGYVWVCAQDIARFDPETQTWDTNYAVGGSGGCMADGEGKIWLAADPLVAIDTQTLEVVQTLDIPSYAHGVSIDFHGYVWGVTVFEPYAYRVDPATGEVSTFEGLFSPYTYSDMTGFALKNAGTIPMPAG